MVETRAYDEMHGASGEVREHYRAFADFRMVRTRWSESLRHAFHQLPDPDWIRRS